MQRYKASWYLTTRRLYQARLFRSTQFKHGCIPRRHFGLDTVTAVLIPPAVFCGLLISLWTYKCIMMVIFQNKIIYMPGVPPFSRSEKILDHASQCWPVQWTEHTIQSTDGTKIKLLDGSVPFTQPADKEVVILYYQGNASSLPPRLPYLSQILSAAQHCKTRSPQNPTRYRIVALSYRGFWTSSGRPSQPGIERDAEAAIRWVHENSRHNAQIVLWGQSIGAGAATVSLSNWLAKHHHEEPTSRVAGLLLETPFVDLRTMLVALYPQKFLPYQYLAPFLMSTWDSKTALNRIGDLTVGVKTKSNVRVLILRAGDDELVPEENAGILEQVCREKGLEVTCLTVKGALHTDVMMKSQGRKSVVEFVRSFGGG